MTLEALAAVLRDAPGLSMKREIQRIAARLPAIASCAWAQGDARTEPVRNGDDTAAIRDGDGYLLFAAEGMLPSFVQRDPWFAGFSSVMVNVSDVVAMGGRPLAVVDVLFAGDAVDNDRLLAGIRDAAAAFGVPVVGGHTSRLPSSTALAVAILGRAARLITSFDARRGLEIVVAVDLRGAYRGPGNNFNAATYASSEQLRSQLEILPELAEAGLAPAGKDISMAGLAGTLLMLCEASGCGAVLHPSAVPRPPEVELERWLQTFPSYGFILAVAPEHVEPVRRRFAAAGVASASVGYFQDEPVVEFREGDERAVYWDLGRASLTGFGASVRSAEGATASGATSALDARPFTPLGAALHAPGESP